PKPPGQDPPTDSPGPVVTDVTFRVVVRARRLRSRPGRSRFLVTLLLPLPDFEGGTPLGGTPVFGPLSLVLNELPHKVRVRGATGVPQQQLPAGRPYVDVPLPGNLLVPGQSVSVLLTFRHPEGQPVRFGTSVLAGVGPR